MRFEDNAAPLRATESASHCASREALAPSRQSLTEAMLARLTAPTTGELRLYDTKVPGLLLRWRAGSRSPRWYILKRVRERTVQSVLGELSTWPGVSVTVARQLATAALADLAKGISPSDVRTAARKAKAAQDALCVPMADVWKRHKKTLNERGRCAEYIREFQLLAEQSAAAGIDDLRQPGIAAKADTWLMKQDLAPSTRRRRRGFFKDLGTTAMRWWGLTANPFEPLEMAKPAVADVDLFTLPQCFALMSDAGMKHAWGALGALLLYHGLRLQEGVWMHWDRIDTEAGVLRVTPPTPDEWKLGYRVKRNKAREVPLQEECIQILKAIPRNGDGYLFSRGFRTLNRKTHWRHFRAWCKSVDVDPGTRHPHTLRHQRATVGLASNEGELRLQLSLGHVGSEMTGHYAQKAMQWKKALGHWHGVMRFRDPAEVARWMTADSQSA